MHSKEAKIHGERELRIYHIPIWRESPLFSNAEKMALEWTEALTNIEPEGVSDALYERARAHSEVQLSELFFAVAVINLWDRLNLGFRNAPASADEMLGLKKSGLKYEFCAPGDPRPPAMPVRSKTRRGELGTPGYVTAYRTGED